MKKHPLFLLLFSLILLIPCVVKAATDLSNDNAHSASTSVTASSPNTSASGEKKPIVAEQAKQQEKINSLPLGLSLYRPTYALPFYYTGTPDQSVYGQSTPLSQKINNLEFKAQISFQIPIVRDLLNDSSLSLNAAYTQLSYWQFYVRSQYFRETDYEPELFLSKKLANDQQVDLGVDHQSNGRGGDLERSWNRAYVNYSLSGIDWMVNVRPWIPIFKAESINLHNRDIMSYMGYGWVVGTYKFHKQTISLMVRNELESGFSRGAEEIDWTFPLLGRLNFMVQGFSGYGQSLIEYNHYTNSIGVGIALNNWA